VLHVPRCAPRCDQLRTRQRVSSYGFDPILCGIAGPAYPVASLIQAGLRVPPMPTGIANDEEGNLVQQYWFQAATLKLSPGRCVRITRIGQLVVLGNIQGSGDENVFPPFYANVLNQVTPTWKFPDVLPIQWGLRFVRQPPTIPLALQNPLSTDSFCYQWSDGPACIFNDAVFLNTDLNWNGTPSNYLSLIGYTAPFQGGFPGEPIGEFGHFQSLDFPWNDPSKQSIDPITVSGPGAIVAYIIVTQTNPSTRQAITTPETVLFQPNPWPEEAWVKAFPLSNYYSVGMSFETENL
jgi:hypothetical protein